MDPWSLCTASCGGGSQTRSVRCVKGPEGRSREVGSQHCLSTGRRPSDTRLCNQLPCARWATTQWGLVSAMTLIMFSICFEKLIICECSSLSVMVSVLVPAWQRSTAMFTARTLMPPKSPTGCAAAYRGKYGGHIKSILPVNG